MTDGRTERKTDRQTDGRRTDFGTKLTYPFFLKKSVGVKNHKDNISDEEKLFIKQEGVNMVAKSNFTKWTFPA